MKDYYDYYKEASFQEQKDAPRQLEVIAIRKQQLITQFSTQDMNTTANYVANLEADLAFIRNLNEFCSVRYAEMFATFPKSSSIAIVIERLEQDIDIEMQSKKPMEHIEVEVELIKQEIEKCQKFKSALFMMEQQKCTTFEASKYTLDELEGKAK